MTAGRVERDAASEQWIAMKLQTCNDLLRHYMLHIKRKTSMTRRAYLGYLMQYCSFMQDKGKDLKDVRPMDIDEYMAFITYTNGKENGHSIINTKLAAVISFYDFLVENRIVDENPCSTKMKLPLREKEDVVYMTDEEVEHLFENIRSGKNRRSMKYVNRDLCIAKLGCNTGLRVSAICNINLEDINFDENYVMVTEKGNKIEKIFFGDEIKKSLLYWIDDRQRILDTGTTNALFINPKHERIRPGAVNEMLQKETKEFHKHITAHKMRSTCGMSLYEKTGDLYLVQQQLKHKNIQNTKIYAKATEQKMRHAAELLNR